MCVYKEFLIAKYQHTHTHTPKMEEEEQGAMERREESERMKIQVFYHLNTTQQPETSVGVLVGRRVTEKGKRKERKTEIRSD